MPMPSVIVDRRLMPTITFSLVEQGCCDNNMSVLIVRKIYEIGLSKSVRQNESCMFQRAACLTTNLWLWLLEHGRDFCKDIFALYFAYIFLLKYHYNELK